MFCVCSNVCDHLAYKSAQYKFVEIQPTELGISSFMKPTEVDVSSFMKPPKVHFKNGEDDHRANFAADV